jgi:hypothetical protein
MTTMTTLKSRVLSLLLLSCALVLTGLLLRSGLGQVPAQAQSSRSGGDAGQDVGRYALYHTTPLLNSTGSVPVRVFLLDTKTGRVWERGYQSSNINSWVDLGPHSQAAR